MSSAAIWDAGILIPGSVTSLVFPLDDPILPENARTIRLFKAQNKHPPTLAEQELLSQNVETFGEYRGFIVQRNPLSIPRTEKTFRFGTTPIPDRSRTTSRESLSTLE